MPLVISYNDAPGHVETWGTPELTTVTGLVTKADQGTPGTCKVDLPDEAGTHATAGLRRIYIAETDSPADFKLVYDGYLTMRDYARGKAVTNLAGARTITVNLVDLNNLLTTHIIQGTKTAAHGNRPRETDVQRVQWLMSSPYIGSINDFGLVSTGSPVYLDATDYRNQNAYSVLRDCALKGLKQFFCYYDETQPTVNRIGLFYDFEKSAAFSSTLRISNHPGDADWAVTFECDSASPPVQHRDPSQIITGVNVEYDGGSVFVDSDDIGLTTRTDYYVREVSMQSSNTKVRATAIELGEQMLRDHDKEEDSASVRILIPSTHVGQIKAGHRISCRFDHFTTEYRDFTWWRINQLTVNQLSQKWYMLDMEMVPLTAASNFLVMFQTAAFATQPTDLSTNPWTLAWWSGDFTTASVIGCGAGPPANQGMGMYYRQIVPGESATVATFKNGASSAGGAWVYQISGVDLTTVLSTITAVNSNVFVANAGTVTVSASPTVPSTLIGGFGGGKVNYDDGWQASSSSNWGGVDLVTTSAGTTQLINASSFNGTGARGATPWAWIAHREGSSGTLSLSAVLDSHGGGSGAYNCGYNVGKGGLLIETPGGFSVVQSAYGGDQGSGGTYSVTLGSAPVA